MSVRPKYEICLSVRPAEVGEEGSIEIRIGDAMMSWRKGKRSSFGEENGEIHSPLRVVLPDGVRIG